jgi:outer membrane protein TolC
MLLLIAAFACLRAPDALAQLGPTPSPPQVIQATPLSLSGRSSLGGSVTASQSPIPGTTTSVNTINPSIQVQGPYTGSVPSTAAMPFNGRLSLEDAMERGLGFNLGPAGFADLVNQSSGQSKVMRSVLLPNIAGVVTGAVQQTNLRAAGIGLDLPPGFTFPTIIGPFNFTDFRVRLTQTVLDLTALNNYRSAEEVERSNVFLLADARDLTTLAVGGAYLQVIAAEARVESAKAQLETATALYKQMSEQRAGGIASQIDLNRAHAQALTEQQRLVSLENDLAKQKINLARMTGIPVNDQYTLTSEVLYSPAPPMTVDEALKLAFAQRADLKAAEAQVSAADRNRAAARSERLPSLFVSADYGAIGINPGQSHGTFSIVGNLRIPIWQGGRVSGEVRQSEAALAQRRAELADVRGRIESDVRNAFLDLRAASSQVDVAQLNLRVSEETLTLTRQKLDAGISDNLAVVQSQEELASAHLDYINSVFAHNVAKLALARAVGQAAANWQRFVVVR